MFIKRVGVSVGALLCGMTWAAVAMAQGPTGTPAPAPAQPAPAPAQPAPAPAQPAPAPAQPATVPPGYVLVPIQPPAQTQYSVQYPQQRGALPPGMELPYEEGDPIPPGYRIRKQPRRGLIVGGSIMLGVGWGLSVTAATAANMENKSGFLLIPALGPWLMLATGGAKDRDCEYSSTYGYSSSCGDRSGLRALLVLDGLLQTGGAVMLISGIAFPRVRLVRDDVTMGFVPTTFGSGSYGLGAVGTF